MVTIPVADFALEAEARLPPGAPGVVVCHPHPAFGGHMDNPLVVALADTLAVAGLGTVRFNFRGVDGSGGTPTGGLREHEDVLAVADWLRARTGRVALVGYSFGALMAARAVATGCATFAFAAVALPTTIVGDDAERVAQLEAAIATRIPSLFIAGDADQFCEIDRVATWIDGKPWATQDVLHGCGHFPGDTQTRELCARVADFVRRC
jgi:alpha/beta superfamily hydrolase